ncbi:hypothetical protein Tco_0153452 [Tanacetum coccineum]
MADKNESNKVINTLVSIANIEGVDTTIFAASDLKEKKNIPRRTIPHVQAFVTKNVHNKIGEVNGLLTQCAKHQMLLIIYIEKILHSSVKVPRDILVVKTKHFRPRKGHSQTFDDDILKQVMLYMEEGGSAPCIPNLHHLTAAGGRPMTLEEAKLQMQETKRLADLQVKREKAEKKNRIILTSKKLTTQEEELAEIEAKHVLHMNKMRDEYNLCSKFRDDALPITNFIYRINKSSKLATMRITRNNQPLNLKVFDRFVLKMLGFTEWLELHSMASKRKSTSNDQLLKNIRAKFQWVESTADKLMIPPPPQLTALNFL